MLVNSINNCNFGASLSGDVLKIINKSIANNVKDAEISKAFSVIHDIANRNNFDIWLVKPIKTINFRTRLPQDEAKVIISNGIIQKGIKFTPDKQNPNLLEQYIFAIKKLIRQDFSKQSKVTDDGIEWIA